MKILHVNYSDSRGGAAIAANRLHKALLKDGIDSKMLVCEKKTDDPNVIGPVSKFQKLMNQGKPYLDQLPVRLYKDKSPMLFTTSWYTSKYIINKINNICPDVVHLHWISGGMLKIEHIAKIKSPIVWSLHDMWAFTGGCHYDENCELYKKQCGTCKVLKSMRDNDLSRKIFRRKEQTYSKINNLTVVGLSKWIADLAKKSTLFSNLKVINLPNLIDATVYKALDKNYSRQLYNLSLEKKLICFGAMAATDDPRKGYAQLIEALKKNTLNNVECVVFGSKNCGIEKSLPIKINFIGKKYDDESLVALYNSADILVVPSIQENLSNVIMESLACGTPVVAFDIGGNGDMIEHKINGYLAKPFNTVDLAEGLNWVLSKERFKKDNDIMIKNHVNKFSENVVSKKYIALYNDIIKNK